MLDCIEWLDKHNGSFVALATLALVVVTIWYARSTSKLLREAQAQRTVAVCQALAQALLARSQVLAAKQSDLSARFRGPVIPAPTQSVGLEAAIVADVQDASELIDELRKLRNGAPTS